MKHRAVMREEFNPQPDTGLVIIFICILFLSGITWKGDLGSSTLETRAFPSDIKQTS